MTRKGTKRSSGQNSENISVAIVYHYLPHYREAIFNLLCRQNYPDPKYIIFSDNRTYDSIKTIDPIKASVPPAKGGINWRFIRNYGFGKYFLWQQGLIRLAISKEFKVIIYLGNIYHLSTWVSLIIARLSGKRTLMWTHGFLRDERGIKGWLRTRFYKLSNGLLLYGNIAREILIKRGFDPDSLYVVYNSLDYDRQCRIRKSIDEQILSDLKKKLFPFPALPVVIFNGRLTPQKKLDMIIRAVGILRERDANVNLLFVGDGPERKLLEKRAHDFSLHERVVFYNACYNEEELGPLISLADLCVAPGEVGLTCMHSLVYGTPVITHNNPENQMPEWEAIQPGINGAFFKEDDVNDLAKVIGEWLNKQHSREEVRRNCHDVVDKFYNPLFQQKVLNAAVCNIPATHVQ
jgi:glycosyltransferase involved in cell wall biosynthesis